MTVHCFRAATAGRGVDITYQREGMLFNSATTSVHVAFNIQQSRSTSWKANSLALWSLVSIELTTANDLSVSSNIKQLVSCNTVNHNNDNSTIRISWTALYTTKHVSAQSHSVISPWVSTSDIAQYKQIVKFYLTIYNQRCLFSTLWVAGIQMMK